jgi:hypothetical protein
METISSQLNPVHSHNAVYPDEWTSESNISPVSSGSKNKPRKKPATGQQEAYCLFLADHFSAQKMEAVRSSEMWADFPRTTQRKVKLSRTTPWICTANGDRDPPFLTLVVEWSASKPFRFTPRLGGTRSRSGCYEKSVAPVGNWNLTHRSSTFLRHFFCSCVPLWALLILPLSDTRSSGGKNPISGISFLPKH